MTVKALVQKLKTKKELAIIVIIVLLSILITLLNSNFLTVNNIFDFLRSNAVYGVMAFGMLPVLISGGIDLSVSSTIALCAVVAGTFAKAFPGSNIAVVILLAVAVGALVGLVNGLLITKLKIPPIVATLGTQTIILAAVQLYTGGMWISDLPEWYSGFGGFQLGAIPSAGKTVGISTQVMLLILAGVVVWLILKYTLIGRSIYAVGGNAQSAMRVGYNVDRTLIVVYILSGVMAGLGSIVHTTIVGQIDPNTYLNYEMDVISIVVLGGASLAGGVGTILGTSLGIVLMAIIKNGLVLARVSSYWQDVVMGLIILVTISVDVINYKREQARLVKVDVEGEGGE